MLKLIVLSLLVVIFLGGCSGKNLAIENVPPQINEENELATVENQPEINLVLPVADYMNRLTFKAFGEFIQDRFQGFHVGDDIEYSDLKEKVFRL